MSSSSSCCGGGFFTSVSFLAVAAQNLHNEKQQWLFICVSGSRVNCHFGKLHFSGRRHGWTVGLNFCFLAHALKRYPQNRYFFLIVIIIILSCACSSIDGAGPPAFFLSDLICDPAAAKGGVFENPGTLSALPTAAYGPSTVVVVEVEEDEVIRSSTWLFSRPVRRYETCFGSPGI